ncbi:MAG TPA: sigma 54-interacting transcriptional regulator [Longimicrobiales bacterium]
MPVLSEVWREVSRHLELREATELIAPLIRRRVPISALVIRRLDLDQQRADTAAAWHEEPQVEPSVIAIQQHLIPRLFEWTHHTAVRRIEPDDVFADLIRPGHPAGDVVAVPLAIDGRPAGLMCVQASGKARFTTEQMDLLGAVSEPVSVALANDARLHEMSRMREALEADKRALLSRLGRQDVADAIVGAESGLRDVMEQVKRVAPTDAPVLLLGETGTGKEVIARAVHAHSARARGPVERVNCGAIPVGLVDSELFGHERGSFTGAINARKGWFERSDGGTLFLDEIGELPLEAQVRLLRILQDGTFERVGAQKTLRVDVRIIAATHKDLGEMVAAGQFREDLWYRLNVFPIRLPPLRERPQDIPSMAAHFAWRVGQRLGRGPLTPSRHDLELLVRYPWPGNVRELAAVIERAAILGNGQELEVAAALGVTPAKLASDPAPARTSDAPDEILTLDAAMAEHIRRALVATRGRIEGPKGAAQLLGINPHTLRARMRKLRVEWQQFRAYS